MAGKSVNVFFSYSHQDEEWRDKLATHLAGLKHSGVIRNWHDRKITPGDEWADEIDAHLSRADIILLLVSADFLASNYCWDVEVQKAMERHESGKARVIPIIIRPVDWSDTPFYKLQALPKNAEPITSRNWASADEAFHNVVQGIRKVVDAVLQQKHNKAKDSSLVSPITSQVERDSRRPKPKLEKLRSIRKAEQTQIQQTQIPLAQEELNQVEEQLNSIVSPQTRRALEWLSKRDRLSELACDYAAKNSPDIKELLEQSQESQARDRHLSHLTWELNKYLELLYYSMYSEERDLLDVPPISPSFPIDVYAQAFKYLKNRIPETISVEIRAEVEARFDHLLRML